jgi:hypothetical protein
MDYSKNKKTYIAIGIVSFAVLSYFAIRRLRSSVSIIKGIDTKCNYLKWFSIWSLEMEKLNDSLVNNIFNLAKQKMP